MDAQSTDALTSDRLLGGRVEYRQPRDGLRASLDPVLLAASIPARPGERVLEAGTGAGAALLCLAARVPGLTLLGFDRDVDLVRLARRNAAANGAANLHFVAADIAACPAGGAFDHAFANPPYHAATGTRSPSSARDAAKRAEPDTLPLWVAGLAASLRHRGTLTLIVPPALLEPALIAMRGCSVPGTCVFPVWPKAGRPARFVLVRGRRHSRAPLSLPPGLILHAESGGFTPEADAILRNAADLSLSGHQDRS